MPRKYITMKEREERASTRGKGDVVETDWARVITCRCGQKVFWRQLHPEIISVYDIDDRGLKTVGLHSCKVGGSLFVHSAGGVDTNRRRH
jgi:hypothetical protein